MKYVIDCSVAFKWFVSESDTDKALRLRNDFQSAVLEIVAEAERFVSISL